MKEYAVCLVIREVEVNEEGDFITEVEGEMLSSYPTLAKASEALIDVVVEHDLTGLQRFQNKITS